MTARRPDWLAPALDYVTGWIEHQLRLAELPGCVIAVRHGGDLLLERAFGVASLATGTPLSPRHRFRVASHSKAFTAAGVMRLREQGRLGLDDAIGTYLDGLHPEVAAVTVQQLLSNGGGLIRDGSDSRYWSGRRAFATAAEILAEFAVPPVLPANERLKYSNYGFALAGLLVEAIVGESYGTWLAREVITAAGLEETTPDYDPSDCAEFASGHGTRTLLGARQVYPVAVGTGALAPAAGVVSTAADLTRFFHQLSPEAERSFLSPASRREMVRGQRSDAHAAKLQYYGLGIMSGAEGERPWFGHGGGFQGVLTRTAVLPREHIAVSILTHAGDGKAHVWVDGIIAILGHFSRHARPDPTWAAWCGRWWNVWGPIDLVALGDRVYLASPDGNDPFDHAPALVPMGPDTARIVEASAYHHFGEMVRLERAAGGKVAAVHIAGDVWLSEAAFRAEVIDRYGPPPSA